MALWVPQAHVEAHQWVEAGAKANPGIVFQAMGDNFMLTAESNMITAEYHRSRS